MDLPLRASESERLNFEATLKKVNFDFNFWNQPSFQRRHSMFEVTIAEVQLKRMVFDYIKIIK